MICQLVDSEGKENIMDDSKKSKKKLLYINYFRAIAILLVVAGHSLVSGKGVLRYITSYLFDGSTYVFVFISGFLFFYLSYKFNYFSYLKKKFLNVICPTIFTLLPGTIAFIFFNNDTLINKSRLFRGVIALVYPYVINPPIWFIIMISVYFLFAPLLLKISKNKPLFIFTLLFTLWISIIYYRVWPTIDYNTMRLRVIVVKYFIWYFFISLHFISFYFLGMFICELLMKRPNLVQEYVKKITLINFCVWLCFGFTGIFIKKPPCNWNIYLLLSKINMIIWILGALITNEEKIKYRIKINKTLNILADYSFGIFFIHFLFRNMILKSSLYAAWKTNRYILCDDNLFTWFCSRVPLFLFMLIGSILFLFILRRVLIFLGVKNTRMFIGV